MQLILKALLSVLSHDLLSHQSKIYHFAFKDIENIKKDFTEI